MTAGDLLVRGTREDGFLMLENSVCGYSVGRAAPRLNAEESEVGNSPDKHIVEALKVEAELSSRLSMHESGRAKVYVFKNESVVLKEIIL